MTQLLFCCKKGVLPILYQNNGNQPPGGAREGRCQAWQETIFLQADILSGTSHKKLDLKEPFDC